MLGHLRPDEFMVAIDGGSLPVERKAHVDSCTGCMAQLHSIETAYHTLLQSADDQDIPEPDWTEFRGSVRTELLSRSIQRESAVRRWTGWPVRPAMAWAFSFLLLMCVSAGVFYWHLSHEMPPTLVQTTAPVDSIDDDADVTAWTNTSVFEELSTMEEPQAERLRLLIESAQTGTLTQQ